MSPFVQAFCEQNGYPYLMYVWAEAVLQTFKIFGKPKPVYRYIDELREAVRQEVSESVAS